MPAAIAQHWAARSAPFQHRRDQSVACRTAGKHDMPGLHIGVRGGTHRKFERFLHQPPRHRAGQEHARRTPQTDGLIQVVHASMVSGRSAIRVEPAAVTVQP